MGDAKPFVADQQHGLGQIQRGVGGVDGEGDDGVGARNLVAVHAGALRPEQNAGLAQIGDQRRRLVHGDGGAFHALALAAFARGGRPHEIEIGGGLLQRLIELGALQQMHGAGGGGERALAQRPGTRPAVARVHQPQIGEAKIGHGAGAHANVHRQLRAHENDRRAALDQGSRFIRACAGHDALALLTGEALTLWGGNPQAFSVSATADSRSARQFAEVQTRTQAYPRFGGQP